MEQRKRRKLLQEYIHEACSELGFRYLTGDIFVRERGELSDVFFFQQTRGNNQYYITYGTDCLKLLPSLRDNSIFKLGGEPRLLITNGRLEKSRTYGCKYEEHIANSSRKVAEALKTEAEPWFSKFNIPNDAIEQYRVSEVQLNSPSEELPLGKIICWCQYGLMLVESGDESGHDWLAPVLSTYKSKPKLTAHDKEWIRIVEKCHP